MTDKQNYFTYTDNTSDNNDKIMENLHKQIIIDGVDVSGCEFLRNCIIPDNYGCKIDDSLCCDVGNCYYKQHERKELECEELNKEIHNLNSTIDFIKVTEHSAINKYNKLKQALTEIKEIAEHCMKQDICTTCDNSDKCHIEDEEIPTYDVCKLILQKISECEINYEN